MPVERERYIYIYIYTYHYVYVELLCTAPHKGHLNGLCLRLGDGLLQLTDCGDFNVRLVEADATEEAVAGGLGKGT